MKLEVMLFGPLRAFGDGRAVVIEVRDGASAGEARAALGDALGRLGRGDAARALVERSVLATDSEVLEEDAPLPRGLAQLAVLPPVCGG